MKPRVILRTVRSGVLPDGKGAMVEVETTEGPLELRFTEEDAGRLASAVQAARKELEALRVKTGKPPLGTARTPQRWETAIDPASRDRAHHALSRRGAEALRSRRRDAPVAAT